MTNRKRHETVAELLNTHSSVDSNKQEDDYRALLKRYSRNEISLAQLEKLDPANQTKPENISWRQLFAGVLSYQRNRSKRRW